MIQFFNKAVCIILVIIITILFIKTIYSEHFTADEKLSPVYYGIYDDNNFDNLLERLVNDREFVESINKLYKKEYNKSELKQVILDNKELLFKTKRARDELKNIPQKCHYLRYQP